MISPFNARFLITLTIVTINHVHCQSIDELETDHYSTNSRPDSRMLPRQSAPESNSNNFHVDVHTHPKTTFSCLGKQAGEYYADVEAKCAIYYVCLAGVKGELSPISFACPNGTLFNQANKVCAQEEMVFCALSTRYYESVRGKLLLTCS